MFLCDLTLKKIDTEIETLNNESANRYDYNPTEHIKSGLRSAESTVVKLKKDGYEMTIESMMECLNDIVGIRIICPFTSDIYQVIDMIAAQGNVTVPRVKDYIKNPKPNRYKSHYMIVAMSVYLMDGPVKIKVEIQIRSVAVDLRASLEHKITYKFKGSAPESLLKKLRVCIDIADMLDAKAFSLNETVATFAREQKERPEES